MALQWITPIGDIGNIYVGLPATLEVMAIDFAKTNSPVTYQLIGGALPTGMSLSSNGVITGTPIYSSPSNNNFVSQTFNIIVRARNSVGSTPIDGKFVIRLSNTVNSDFEWITPAGNLGTVPSGNYYHLPLSITETLPGVTVTFSHVSGELPPGVQVRSD